MKPILLLACLFPAADLAAQHNVQEIKNFKISKIIKESVTRGIDSKEKYEYRYDDKGNETASYINDDQISRAVHHYNPAGRLTRTTSYDMIANGAESSVSEYTYQADGSYRGKTTYPGMETFELKWYDKTGRLIRTMAYDKAEDIYQYNAGGKLISVKTKAGTSEGDVTDLKYTYNTKGQRIRELSEGPFRWTRTYFYDSKGMLSKVITVGADEGETTTTTTTYTYEFRK